MRIRYNHYYLAEMHPVLQCTTVCYSMHPRCALTLWVCCLRWTWCLLVTSFVIILYFLLLAFVVLLNSTQKKGKKRYQVRTAVRPLNVSWYYQLTFRGHTAARTWYHAFYYAHQLVFISREHTFLQDGN